MCTQSQAYALHSFDCERGYRTSGCRALSLKSWYPDTMRVLLINNFRVLSRMILSNSCRSFLTDIATFLSVPNSCVFG